MIVDTSADGFEFSSKFLLKEATFLTKAIGEFLDEGQERVTSDSLKLGAQSTETMEGVMEPRAEAGEFDVIISGVCGLQI